MSISNKKREKWNNFTADEAERIVRMAWEDRTSFDAIKTQFDLSPNEVVQFMRTQLPSKSYERWRRRANTQGHLKHEKQRPFTEGRFRCSRQRSDGSTKGWK